MIWTPRHRRYLKILKRRRMIDQSTHPQYDKGTLVMRTNGWKGMYMVEAHRNDAQGLVECQVIRYITKGDFDPRWEKERNLRLPTFFERMWFRHPKTGQMRMMNWALWEGLLRIAAAIAFVICGLGLLMQEEPEPWGWSAIGLGLSMMTIMYLGFRRNWMGKQM